MRRPTTRALAHALALAVPFALAACGFSNSMYHANRLTKEAERAEREGRRFDAQSYWGQAVVKADTVLARHPTGDLVDDAHFVRGLAYVKLGQCPRAVESLEQARLRLTDAKRLEQATALLAGCRLAAGDTAGAAALSAHLRESRDERRRREAQLHLAAAQLSAGAYEQAIAATDSLADRQARRIRLIALASLGRGDAALALAESLLATRDSAGPWELALTRLGARDPSAASRLLDRLVATGDQRPEVVARWLAADARRLAPHDSAAAERRLAALAALGDVARDPLLAARVDVVRLALARAGGIAALPPLEAVLDSLGRLDPTGLTGAPALQGVVRFVIRAGDSTPPGTPSGDLALFVAGEYARDSLDAPRVAAELFRRVVDEWPDSPFAAKALLAGRRLDPAWAELTQPLLEERYRDSPYVAALRGEQVDAFRALEDSLRTYALRDGQAVPVSHGAEPAADSLPVLIDDPDAPASGGRAEPDGPTTRPRPRPSRPRPGTGVRPSEL